MKKRILFLLVFVVANTLQAQLSIPVGETLQVTGTESLYSNEPIVNAGTLTLGTGILEIGGAYTNTGSVNLSTATLKLSGNASQSISFGSVDTAKKIELNKSANTATVTAGALSITDFVQSVQGTLNADGKITLKSTATKTAIVEFSTGGAINNLVVERFIPARRAFRFVSSPVTTSTSIKANWQENGANTANLGTHITGTGGISNGFDATATDNASMFTFTNSTSAWVAVTNTNGLLTAGNAYRLMIRGDRTIDLTQNAPTATNTTLRTKGSLFIGSKTITDLNQNTDGYSLIGNPYQSPVNMKTVLDNATNLNATYYYVWDPKMATRGAYVTGTLASGANNVSGSQINQYLQPGQACFVKTNTTATTSMHFEEAYKYTTTTNEGVFRLASSAQEKIQLTLYNSASMALQGAALDGLLVFFDANENNTLDGNDAGKFSNLDETMATLNGTKSLSIESRNLPIATEVIQLTMTQYRVSNYTLVMEGTNNSSLPCYLYDSLLQTYTAIPYNGSISYSFSVDASNALSSASNRFQLVFANPNLGMDNPNNILFTLSPNPSNGNFTIALPEYMQDALLTVYNNLGQVVFTEQLLQAGLHQISAANRLSSGVYYVKVTQDNKSLTKKILIK
ncbi:Secretion system C-terminal sorting domain [Flavobacteriaceae bacterium]